MEYAIRIHASDRVTEESIKAFFASQGGSYLVVREHDANRVHFQAWIKDEIKINTLRARVKKAFACDGNADYSVSKCKSTEAYQRYLMKGTKTTAPHVVAYCGLDLSEEKIADMHKSYWTQECGKRQVTSKTLAAEALEWAEMFTDDNPLDVLELSRFLVRRCIQRQKPFDTYQLKRIKNLVMAKCDHHYAEKLVLEIAC